MRRSSSVRVLGSVGREKRSSSLLRKFRIFVNRLRLYQDKEPQPQDSLATDVTNKDREKAQLPESGPSKGRSSDISWWDSEARDAGRSDNEAKGPEIDTKHADYDGNSDRDRNEESQEFDLIYVLPKAATPARALANLGIPFTEQAYGFAVAAGLNESQLFDVMQMTRRLHNLDGLRKMTCDCLLRTPTSGLDSSLLEPDASHLKNAGKSGQPCSSRSNPTAANIFDEDVMYGSCSRVTRDIFHDNLRTWMAPSFHDTSAHTDHVVGLPASEVNTSRLQDILGWKFQQQIDISTGRNMLVALTNFASFEKFLESLWLALSTSRLSKRSGELRIAEEKLPSAVLTLATTVHTFMESAEQLPCHAFYQDIAHCFTRLFGALNDLETHALTIETVHETGKSTLSQAGYSVILRHLTTALLLATKALTELKDQTDILQGEKSRREEDSAKTTLETSISADYHFVKECCSKVFTARKEAHRQKRFQQGVVHLEQLGWHKAAARTILLNECRRRRITHHAGLAARMLEASFLKALTPDPSRKIRWKATALPTDLAALLITQVLERPVLDDQDALSMYMRYVTDLVSLSSITPES